MKHKTTFSLLCLALPALALPALALPVLARPMPCGDSGPVPQPPTNFGWMHGVEELTPAGLTVRAQTVSPNDDGRLLWDIFFPRQNVDSTKLGELTPIDFRPASDRRGWNRRGRRIPLVTPKIKEMRIEPVEANFRVDEKEMDDYVNRFAGNEELVRREMGATFPQRVESLALANYRRVDLDDFEAWQDGEVTIRNPEDNRTYTVDYGFAPERYQSAGTIWTGAGVNAYNEFIAFLNDSVELVGPIEGAMLRLKVRQAILEDAPTLAGGAAMSLANLEDRISQDTGQPFRFYVNAAEKTTDVFDDGGIKTSRRKRWGQGKIGVIPAGRTVGTTAFAPVARARQLANAVPMAQIDIRGNTVFMHESNGGRELDVECQLNPFPLPDEGRIAVMDTLIRD